MKRKLIGILCMICVVCAGCGATKESTAKEADTAPKDKVEETKTEEANVEQKPLLENSSGKVMIQCVADAAYKYNSYMITSANGENLVIDPTGVATKEDYDMNVAAIVSTHNHPDHVDKNFTNSYPDAQKLIYEDGSISTKDFKVTMIPSSHKGDTINTPSTNYIALIEVDGLRIVHMGDCGQTSLTEEQLAQLGEVDICFMQYTNQQSGIAASDGTAAKIMEQLSPKRIIPTHYMNDDLEYLAQQYGEIEELDNVMYVDKEDVSNDSLTMYRILNNVTYK